MISFLGDFLSSDIDLHMLKGKAASCPARLRMVANQSVRYIRLRFNMLIMTYLIPINLSFEPLEKAFFRNYSTSWPCSLGRTMYQPVTVVAPPGQQRTVNKLDSSHPALVQVTLQSPERQV